MARRNADPARNAENSAARRPTLRGCARALGREDVPAAPPSVRGADNALDRLRSLENSPETSNPGPGSWNGAFILGTSNTPSAGKHAPQTPVPVATKPKKKIYQDEWDKMTLSETSGDVCKSIINSSRKNI